MIQPTDIQKFLLRTRERTSARWFCLLVVSLYFSLLIFVSFGNLWRRHFVKFPILENQTKPFESFIQSLIRKRKTIYQSVHRSKLTTFINRSFLRLPLFYRPSFHPALFKRATVPIQNKLRGRAGLVLEPSQQETEEVRWSLAVLFRASSELHPFYFAVPHHTYTRFNISFLISEQGW